MVQTKSGDGYLITWDVAFGLPAKRVKGTITYKVEFLEQDTLAQVSIRVKGQEGTRQPKVNLALLRAARVVRTLAAAMRLDDMCSAAV